MVCSTRVCSSTKVFTRVFAGIALVFCGVVTRILLGFYWVFAGFVLGLYFVCRLKPHNQS